MGIAPPPLPGSRIQELDDQLVVLFSPRRWGTIAFLAFWLIFWTVGGMAAFSAAAEEDGSARGFLLLWLGGWALGECAVAVIIAWQLFGREVLIVTPELLEVRQEIGRFARSRRYDSALVRDVRAAQVPHDEDELPRRDFCLMISYGAETLQVGQGLGAPEAEHVASTVLSRLRPRAWWGDETAGNSSQPRPDSVADSPSGRRRAVAVLGAALVLGLVFAVLGRFGEPAAPPSEPPTAEQFSEPRAYAPGPPSAEGFSEPGAYAAATTIYALTSGKTKVLGRPDCGGRATWTAWACTVKAQPTTGPFAGRTFTYRCRGRPEPRAGGSARVVNCGPVNPPPLPGAGG